MPGEINPSSSEHNGDRRHQRGLNPIESTAIVVVLFILAFLLWFFLTPLTESRRRQNCLNNLMMIELACKQYAVDHNDQFPASSTGKGTAVDCFAALTNRGGRITRPTSAIHGMSAWSEPYGRGRPRPPRSSCADVGGAGCSTWVGGTDAGRRGRNAVVTPMIETNSKTGA